MVSFIVHFDSKNLCLVEFHTLSQWQEHKPTVLPGEFIFSNIKDLSGFYVKNDPTNNKGGIDFSYIHDLSLVPKEFKTLLLLEGNTWEGES